MLVPGIFILVLLVENSATSHIDHSEPEYERVADQKGHTRSSTYGHSGSSKHGYSRWHKKGRQYISPYEAISKHEVGTHHTKDNGNEAATDTAEERGSAAQTSESLGIANAGDMLTMCNSSKLPAQSRCMYYANGFQDGLRIYDVKDTIPHILTYLKQRKLVLGNIHLQFIDRKRSLEKINRLGDIDSEDYELEYSDGSKITLGEEHGRYITKNVSFFIMKDLSKLSHVSERFFEVFFPKIMYLEITRNQSMQSHTPVEEMYIGYLPKLQNIRLDYPVNGTVTGCNVPHGKLSCFAEHISLTILMGDFDTPTIWTLANITFPQNVSSVVLQLGKSALRNTEIFVNSVIRKVEIELESTGQIAGLSFAGAVIRERFVIKGGQQDSTQDITRNMDGILHNPSIASLWTWKGEKPELSIPVVFGTSTEQVFKDVNTIELINTTCAFAQSVIAYKNDFSPPYDPSTRKYFHRGFYVDISSLIDTLSRENSDLVELNITTFQLHIRESRNVSYNLHVSYMLITSDNNAAIYHVHKNEPIPLLGNGFKSRGSTGGELKWRDTIDATFMQAFQVCTAIVMADEQNLGSIEAIGNSQGSAMWSYDLPRTFLGSEEEVTVARRVQVQVGEYMEYLQEATSRKAMRVPYLTLQYQQENIGILLDLAESIATEKRVLRERAELSKTGETILEKQDESTISLLRTEYKRTVSLVLVSARRARDINKKLNATENLVKEVNATFYNYTKEMKKENVTFMAGVQRAKAFAIAEVAVSVTSSVLSFFTGGFDPGKVARAALKLKKLTQTIARLMKLTTIFRKLNKLIKTLRNIQALSRKASNAITGRVSRLFSKVKNFRIQRRTNLQRLIEKNVFPKQRLERKKLQNEKFIEKYTKIFEKISTTRDSLAYVNDIVQGIVEAEQAKVTLKNVLKPETLPKIQGDDKEARNVTDADIEDEIRNEFIRSGAAEEYVEGFTQVLNDYDLTKSKDVVEEGERLNAADVLEWDVANANIEGTMDASISMDIPETTSFKAALLKMNLAGKLKTQAMIDEAAIRVDLDRARFETTTYIKEGAAILTKIKEIQKKLQQREHESVAIEQSQVKRRQRLTSQWKEFDVKFKILIGWLGYCSAFYYFHLSPCPQEFNFDFETDLKDIVHRQRELQRQSLLQLEDFYPPPQTMLNRSVSFSVPNKTCECMENVTENADFNLTEKAQQKAAVDKFYVDWLACTSNEIQSNDTSKYETRRLLQRLSQGCRINNVLEMRKANRTTIDIPIDDELAEGHSRVRIDDMQVVLRGARTDNGVIRISIESSGLSQDRYHGNVFNFYGDKWRRDFAYYYWQNRKDGRSSENDKQLHVLDAADVYRSFRGVYRTSTLFTTWVIKVDPAHNRGLDLSNLHQIDLKFSGSFVATEDDEDFDTPKTDNASSDQPKPQSEPDVDKTGLKRAHIEGSVEVSNYVENDEEWYSSI